MAKRPEDRYQTPAELAAALAPFCGDRPPLAIPCGVTATPVATPVAAPVRQAEQNTQTVGPTLDARRWRRPCRPQR